MILTVSTDAGADGAEAILSRLKGFALKVDGLDVEVVDTETGFDDDYGEFVKVTGRTYVPNEGYHNGDLVELMVLEKTEVIYL